MRCTVHVIVGARICAPSAIVIFLGVIIKDKIIKFSKNCGTFTIKESEGGESTN